MRVQVIQNGEQIRPVQPERGDVICCCLQIENKGAEAGEQIVHGVVCSCHLSV
jgi:hypothetical protein